MAQEARSPEMNSWSLRCAEGLDQCQSGRRPPLSSAQPSAQPSAPPHSLSAPPLPLPSTHCRCMSSQVLLPHIQQLHLQCCSGPRLPWPRGHGRNLGEPSPVHHGRETGPEHTRASGSGTPMQGLKQGHNTSQDVKDRRGRTTASQEQGSAPTWAGDTWQGLCWGVAILRGVIAAISSLLIKDVCFSL